MIFVKVLRLSNPVFTQLLARKIVSGLCPPSLSNPIAKSRAHLSILATVGAPGVGQAAVAEGCREELGLESSGGE